MKVSYELKLSQLPWLRVMRFDRRSAIPAVALPNSIGLVPCLYPFFLHWCFHAGVVATFVSFMLKYGVINAT